jgi:hypothetical protein
MLLKVVIMTLACVDDDYSVIAMLMKLIMKVVASGVMTIFCCIGGDDGHCWIGGNKSRRCIRNDEGVVEPVAVMSSYRW